MSRVASFAEYIIERVPGCLVIQNPAGNPLTFFTRPTQSGKVKVPWEQVADEYTIYNGVIAGRKLDSIRAQTAHDKSFDTYEANFNALNELIEEHQLAYRMLHPMVEKIPMIIALRDEQTWVVDGKGNKKRVKSFKVGIFSIHGFGDSE